MFSNIFESAKFWLALGAGLIPLQPGTKRHVAGFGAHLRQLRSVGEAREWFIDRRCNLAVVVPPGRACVDFDTWPGYGAWRMGPGVAVQTVIERTRRGAHVWFRGDLPTSGQAQPVAGVEFKRAGSVVTVAPSVVAGVRYSLLTDFDMPTIRPEWIQTLALSPLSVSPALPHRLPLPNGGPLLPRIKSEFSALTLAQTVTTLRQSGPRYWVGRCPFHEDAERHFWVDVVGNLWGCHAGSCAQSGAHDVINLYAAIHNLTLPDAIRAMGQGGRQ